jgi:hypothetical protein
MQYQIMMRSASMKFRLLGLIALTRSATVAGLLVALVSIVMLGGSKRAEARQAQQAAPSTSPEGDWVRTDLTGVGSFDGLGGSIPKPELTPAGAGMSGRGRGGRGGPGGPAATGTAVPHAVGDPYIVVSRPCGGGGGNGSGSYNPDSGGFHIIVAKNEVVFSQERGGSRIIYMDGRSHPDMTNWTRTAGHSVGHFENGVLVVDTVGLSGGRGAVSTLETHLTERFEVSSDGKHMKIEYTYTDPKLYVKPYTYAYTFDRITPTPSYAFEEWCDASDPIETQSIVPPPQQ